MTCHTIRRRLKHGQLRGTAVRYEACTKEGGRSVLIRAYVQGRRAPQTIWLPFEKGRLQRKPALDLFPAATLREIERRLA